MARYVLHRGHRLRKIPGLRMRGGAVWQLVGLITRRSQVRILPPLPSFSLEKAPLGLFLYPAPGRGREGPRQEADRWAAGPIFV
jgi:hypothetical protein